MSGKNEYLDIYYISQSYFALPRQSVRKNSDIIILFKHTFRNVQSMSYDIGAYDMLYSEIREICKETWGEKFNYLCIEMTKNRNERKYRIFNESKDKYIESIPESESF